MAHSNQLPVQMLCAEKAQRTEEQLLEIQERMLARGGSFVKSLAELHRKADAINQQKLEQTFADYFERYSK